MKLFDKIKLDKTVRTVTKRALFMKAAAISAAGLITITGVTYLFALFFDQSGSFTVKLDNHDLLNSGLSLSETQSFERPTERLSAKPLKNVNNISVYDLPDNLENADGDHSTKNYIAYTFRVKNRGKVTYTYNASIDIQSVTKNLDDAIRFRVYNNGKHKDYAKLKRNGTGPEKNTTPFESQTVVCSMQRPMFKPGNIDKYTVVIWLEGDDSECVDSIIGGSIKAIMNFKIKESS